MVEIVFADFTVGYGPIHFPINQIFKRSVRNMFQCKSKFTHFDNNNNSLYLNRVKTDSSCTADVAVYYNTKQYSTIQYNI